MRKTKSSLQTTAQSLGSLIKSARDIMRKDKGLNGDLDRLPMLTWIMFLKFLGDLELQRETEAELAGKKFQRAIDPPYRWGDWAVKPEGITGDELISFVNNEEAVLPDGSRGPGLFAYLRSLVGRNGGDRRDVIATVFKGTINRMINGYLLRDVINKVAGIHFGSSDELHSLGVLYESMLREMRDAAGDSGEFYTPRAVVRFMVAVTDPRLGERVMDPASGTGGFLVEAYSHLSKQVKTVADRRVLQEKSLFGCEPKPLPYLLCQMTLLLHGLDAPQIDPLNALRCKLTDIGERDRVDVISPIRLSAAKKSAASRAISPKTNRPPKPRCCSCNSSCGNCGVCRKVAQASRLRVPAASRCQERNGAGRPSNSQPGRLRYATPAPPWSCRTAHCSATACVPASRKNF